MDAQMLIIQDLHNKNIEYKSIDALNMLEILKKKQAFNIQC